MGLTKGRIDAAQEGVPCLVPDFVKRQICHQAFISGKPAQKSQISERGSGRGDTVSRQGCSLYVSRMRRKKGRRKLDLEDSGAQWREVALWRQTDLVHV